MIKQDRVEAYNLPIGTILHWLRESGAGRPGLFTGVGLQTYVDPRVEGGAPTAQPQARCLRSCHWRAGNTSSIRACAWTRPSSAAPRPTRRATSPSSTNQPRLGIYTLAVAAKHFGGKVIAQVKQRVEAGSVHPRLTVVPGRLVDAIVVDPTQPQMVSGERPEISGGSAGVTQSRADPPDDRVRHRTSCDAGTSGRPTGQPGLWHSCPDPRPGVRAGGCTSAWRSASSTDRWAASRRDGNLGPQRQSRHPDGLHVQVFDLYDGGLLDVTHLGAGASRSGGERQRQQVRPHGAGERRLL